MAVLLAAVLMPQFSFAADYDIGPVKVSVAAPDGFLALSGADPANFNNFYVKADPSLLEFYCYVKERVPEGACNYHRVLKLKSYHQFANIQFDDAMFAKIKADSRGRMERSDQECGTCQEQAKQIPGIVETKFLGVFADTDQYLGYSTLYAYADHKSVESSISVHVKGKVLFLHASSRYEGDADVQWTRDLLTQWVKQILEQNS
jgi:hypothetical protein